MDTDGVPPDVYSMTSGCGSRPVVDDDGAVEGPGSCVIPTVVVVVRAEFTGSHSPDSEEGAAVRREVLLVNGWSVAPTIEGAGTDGMLSWFAQELQ